ncbi:MAG: DUF302 domain-containing protein [Gammaproteobacteria bacterium]|jgi:uncharacterized protein (DUF302 family)|nr:DUF302 domain-containing protein [Gammaproteobacteria bacterium]MDH3756858.1 DUF302 domain-containing protein [Gammaproteobacteria bacterium]MDH3847811.1 DUF302 domain-containing protein [Gammaproteobacteria bacterium]MDH3864993.1 DUF302 domain-containing protein [Gammaproteobacteria bacterium]MDH3905365.1 DUF302 domain-containing protein [Gammaproteobacteria bacterium]
MDTKFGFGKPVDLGFDEALDTVTEELGKEGFGVLTEIDVQATLKKKLGEDMRPYRILGACNPPLAHQAITAVPEIGLLLPCNVLVREDDEGKVHVSFMDPGSVLGLVDNPDVEPLAAQVREKLERVLAAL